MSHNQSKALRQYLEKCGALSQGPEAIALAKKEYRKQYKREHKKKNKKVDMRPGFTPKEYEGICHRAALYGFRNPTAYIRHVILAAQENTDLFPRKNELLSVLQMISMASIALTEHNSSSTAQVLLEKAETSLLHYLNIPTTNDYGNTD